MTRSAGWKHHIIVGGFLLLLCPPIGWPLVLGYRKELARRLIEGCEPVLPDWRSWKLYLRDGLKAAGVILSYYAPFLAIFWFVAIPRPEVALEHLVEIGLFFVLILFLIPVFLPLLPLLYGFWFPWIEISPAGAAVASVVFWATAFLLPAAFLQVSIHGSFREAFRLRRVICLIWQHFPLYLEAWALSLVATVASVLTGPLAPWGIFWSYLVIIFAFNNVLACSQDPAIATTIRRASAWLP